MRYQRGKYLNAMNEASAEQNEQNIVRVEGDGQAVVFKQIAGLLARRIVFHPKVGDRLERGQRVGLIKFGSRVDVLLDAGGDAASEGRRPGSRRGERPGLPAAERRTGGRRPLFGRRRGTLMELSIPRRRQDESRPTPHAQGDVHSPVAVHYGKHGGWLLRHPRGGACQRVDPPLDLAARTWTMPPRRSALPSCSMASMAASRA